MAVTEYLEHVCRDGTRWDYLAWVYYKNPYHYAGIIAANPQHRKLPILDAGIVLRIPKRTDEELALRLPDSALPPWRR